MADLITYSPLILVLRIWEIVESSHSLLCLFRNVLLKQDRSQSPDPPMLCYKEVVLAASVDAEIWSPFARPDWLTNGCTDNNGNTALHKLSQLHKPQKL